MQISFSCADKLDPNPLPPRPRLARPPRRRMRSSGRPYKHLLHVCMLLALAPLSSSDGSHAPARHLEFGGLQVLQQRHARQLEAGGADG